MRISHTLAFVCVLGFALFLQPRFAQADDVNIAPTPTSEDPEQRILNSVATLLAFQDAIDNDGRRYPRGERTIWLDAGIYDFSANLIFVADPDAIGAELRQILAENYTQSSLPGASDVYFFNSHGLPDPVPMGLNGHGVVIFGREHLRIIGAGPERTSITGNSEIFERGTVREYQASSYNKGFTMADSSSHITIEGIAFGNFETHIEITSGGNVGGNPNNSTFYGNGTDDVRLQNNWFAVDRIQGVGVFGRNHRTTVRNNRFFTTTDAEYPNGWLFLNTVGLVTEMGPLEDFLNTQTPKTPKHPTHGDDKSLI